MNVAVWAGVFLIGGLGSVARCMVDRAVARRAARSFPFGTLTVNISGAVLLGFVTGLTLSHQVALLVGTAFVGAYTTFSTFEYETWALVEGGAPWRALVNVLASVLAGFAAVWLGVTLAR